MTHMMVIREVITIAPPSRVPRHFLEDRKIAADLTIWACNAVMSGGNTPASPLCTVCLHAEGPTSRLTVCGMIGKWRIDENNIHAREHACFVLVDSSGLTPAGEVYLPSDTTKNTA
jgi:hypothetical protein